MIEEVWKDIVGYEGLYQVSNLGNVKNKKGKKIKPRKNKNGYYQVCLSKNNKNKNHYIHKLVALSFITNDKKMQCVNHKNENKLDNNVNNLEWCTYSYNNNYGKMKNLCSKKVLQYDKNGMFIKEWNSMHEIERKLKIFHGSISNCCKNKLKTAGGYVWKYKND